MIRDLIFSKDKDYVAKRSFKLSLVLFLLSFIYLIPEIAFNFSLAEAAGGTDVDEGTLKRIELFGRVISGVGVSLLLIDLLLKGWLARGVLRPLITSAVLIAIIWPTVFYGQKALIEDYLIAPATDEQRQSAYYAVLLKRSLINNTVKIEGIPFDPNAELIDEDKTFLAMFGGLVYGNKGLMADLETHKQDIARQYVGNLARQDFDSYYENYQQIRKELTQAYDRFDKGAKNYWQAMGSTDSEANNVFKQIDGQVAQGYGDYQDTRNQFYRDADKVAEDLNYHLPRIFKGINRCEGHQSCLSRRLNDYDKKMQQHGLNIPDSNYWLKAEEIEYGAGHYAGKLLMGVLTSGLSVAVDAADAIQGNKRPTHRYYIIEDQEHYFTLIKPSIAERFIQKTGYPMNIGSEAEFKTHPKTQKAVADKLRSQGLNLPGSWKIEDRNTIRKLVGGKAVEKAQSQWDNEMRHQGLSLTPEDDWHDFQRDPAIQQRVKNAIGERFYTKPVLMDMNNQQFMNRMVEPAINKEADALIARLSAQTETFAPGGANYEAGKQALRSIVVPPISMGLSLFLILLTVVKIPSKTYVLYRTLSPKPPQGNALNRTLNHRRVPKVFSAAYIVFFFIAFPVSSTQGAFTHRDSTVGHLLTQMRDNSQGFQSNAIFWIMQTQPAFMPLGRMIEHNMGIVSSFTPGDFLLADDVSFSAFFSAIKVSNTRNDEDENEEKSDAPHTAVALTVKTDAGSQVRIMNIKPVYRDGMMLPPGDYDIEVKTPAGKVHRKWITVSDKRAKHVVVF